MYFLSQRKNNSLGDSPGNLERDMSRLYCAQIVGWIITSFDNIDDERRLL